MEESQDNYEERKYYHTIQILKLLFRMVVPTVLLISGIWLLALRIDGIGIIFGLPLVVFGSIFIIYTYDDILSQHFDRFHKKEEEEGK